MSITLMTSAWKSDIPSGRKLVLLALCDSANDQGECYPSIKTIAAKCSMSERAVQGHVSDLERDGVLTREMRNGRSTNYQIHPRRICTPEESAPQQNLHPTPAESAPTPAESAPITITQPSSEPLKPKNKERAIRSTPREATPSAVTLPDWLPEASWEALIEHRKAAKSAMTAQAQRLAVLKLDELRKQGHQPADVIDQTILNGWKGLFPIREGQQRAEKFDPVAHVNRNRTRSGYEQQPGGNVIDITP